MHWVNKSDHEVSGLGTLQVMDGALLVTDAMLLPQKNGRAHTDIEPEDVAKLEYELRNSDGHLRFWWHSHVDMPVFWSIQDLSTQKDLAAGGWFLSTVFNKKDEMRSSICMSKPLPLLMDNIPNEVLSLVDPKQIDQWNEEYRQNVTNVVWTSQYSNRNPVVKKSDPNPATIDNIIQKYADQDGVGTVGEEDDVTWVMEAYGCGVVRATEIVEAWARGEMVEEDDPHYTNRYGVEV
jgi:hypothetical protein